MKDHAISGVPEDLATTHTPVACATYDPDRWMEVQSFVPQPNHHSCLPGRVTKHQAINTISAAMRLIGAPEIDIAAWRMIADITERDAWSASDRSPVNWKRQCDLARELGIGERHFRRIETRLAGYGVLARATADNGYRGRRSGQVYGSPVTCGLSIEPAIANYRALAGIVEEAEIAEEARKQKALEARTARRRIGILVGTLDDIEMRHWAKGRLDELDQDLRPASTRVASHVDLSAWLAALVSLEGEIREAMTPFPDPDGPPADGTDSAAERPRMRADEPAGHENADGRSEKRPVDIVGNQPDMSGAPDSASPVPYTTCTKNHGSIHGENEDHARSGAAAPTKGTAAAGGRHDGGRPAKSLASDDLAFLLDAARRLAGRRAPHPAPPRNKRQRLARRLRRNEPAPGVPLAHHHRPQPLPSQEPGRESGRRAQGLRGKGEGGRAQSRRLGRGDPGPEPEGPPAQGARQAPEDVMSAPCPAPAESFPRTAVPLKKGTLS